MKKKALVGGATGLVGSHLVKILLSAEEYEEVRVIVRRPIGIDHPKLKETVVDFDRLGMYAELFSVDDVFCCLGTTIKKAKTREAMLKIDSDYPLQMAALAVEQGAGQFLIISSMSADPDSKIWYSRMKGKLEGRLKKFPELSVSVLRPSLLLGKRDEFRLGESAGAVLYKILSPFMKGPLRKYRAVQGETVARAMYRIAVKGKVGYTVYPSDEIAKIGDVY
ncbi:MAG: NAD-dependent epimerase/dehydratase family protein [Bacillus sp. (in: firmicutes)]